VADLRRAAARVTCALALASVAYGAFALERTFAFGRRRTPRSDAAPHVTILKPLHGDEPRLAQNLRSFCEQEYPSFEVIFGARDPADAALAAARDIAQAFPERCAVVFANDATPHHANPKIDTLAALVPHARGEILVLADSDMRVTPDYLRAIVAPFADPRVGAVTCLYRGEPADGGLASALGAAANHEQFGPSALVAQTLMGMRFGFGATIAVRRDLFARAGGLDALGGCLADDARLCELVREHGSRVVLSRYVIENTVSEPSLGALWAHELRWARTQRVVQPAGFAGAFLTFPIPLALLHLALARKRSKALAVVAAAFAVRGALALQARRAFGVRAPARPWLIPLRDALGLAVWCAAFASRDVRWSGDDPLRVDADGRIAP
jgi:ceramide glucosyltransferase